MAGDLDQVAETEVCAVLCAAIVYSALVPYVTTCLVAIRDYSMMDEPGQ